MKKIIIELICILLLFTGCMGCKTEPTYIVIPEKDEKTPPISIISLMNARSFIIYILLQALLTNRLLMKYGNGIQKQLL